MGMGLFFSSILIVFPVKFKRMYQRINEIRSKKPMALSYYAAILITQNVCDILPASRIPVLFVISAFNGGFLFLIL